MAEEEVNGAVRMSRIVVGSEEDVAGLKVAVHDVVMVEVGDAVQNS